MDSLSCRAEVPPSHEGSRDNFPHTRIMSFARRFVEIRPEPPLDGVLEDIPPATRLGVPYPSTPSRLLVDRCTMLPPPVPTPPTTLLL